MVCLEMGFASGTTALQSEVGFFNVFMLAPNSTVQNKDPSVYASCLSPYDRCKQVKTGRKNNTINNEWLSSDLHNKQCVWQRLHIQSMRAHINEIVIVAKWISLHFKIEYWNCIRFDKLVTRSKIKKKKKKKLVRELVYVFCEKAKKKKKH